MTDVTTTIADAQPITVTIGETLSLTQQTLVNLTTGSYSGQALSGTEGETGRVLNATGSPVIVAVDGFIYHPDVDYTNSGSVITFTGRTWDNQKITVWK